MGNKSPDHSISESLNSSSPGSPWRVRFLVKRRKPRDQRRNFKNSLRNGKSTPQIEFCKPAFSSGARLLGAPTFVLKTDGLAQLRDPYQLRFDNLIRQLIGRRRSFREMRSQQLTDFLDRFDDCVAEFLVLKMRAHSIDKSLPELFAAFFMNRLVAYHGKLMRAGRDENEHGVAFARSVHAESIKFFLRSNQWIGTQLAALNIDPYLTGGF